MIYFRPLGNVDVVISSPFLPFPIVTPLTVLILLAAPAPWTSILFLPLVIPPPRVEPPAIELALAFRFDPDFLGRNHCNNGFFFFSSSIGDKFKGCCDIEEGGGADLKKSTRSWVVLRWAI
jgi:hypothetical protein